MRANFKFYQLIFKTPGGTSRGILKTKDSWFLFLEANGVMGVGECSLIYGLSPETKELIQKRITQLCNVINKGTLPESDFFLDCPALLFAFETAQLDLLNGGQRYLFDNAFRNGQSIPINGLVWMGEKRFMYDQIKSKLESGYKCIKIKIGAISFDEEFELIEYVRSQFSSKDMEIRVDANGGFHAGEALEKMKILSQLDLHSIEQPIEVNQVNEMAKLCALSPLDVALDEELIGINLQDEKAKLLDVIKPQYIILKPSLIGGFEKSEEWIEAAIHANVGWWITSALESNIGLNAIAQWTFGLDSTMFQGLGTGQLFTNNIPSPLQVDRGHLYSKGSWNLSAISI